MTVKLNTAFLKATDVAPLEADSTVSFSGLFQLFSTPPACQILAQIDPGQQCQCGIDAASVELGECKRVYCCEAAKNTREPMGVDAVPPPPPAHILVDHSVDSTDVDNVCKRNFNLIT